MPNYECLYIDLHSITITQYLQQYGCTRTLSSLTTSRRKYFLTQLPASEISKIKTVEELDKVCSRFTDTIEEDLKKRLFVYREDREKWYAGNCAIT